MLCTYPHTNAEPTISIFIFTLRPSTRLTLHGGLQIPGHNYNANVVVKANGERNCKVLGSCRTISFAIPTSNAGFISLGWKWLNRKGSYINMWSISLHESIPREHPAYRSKPV